MTIIMITHFMEEAMQAQRIVVMDNGKIVQDGTPEQILPTGRNCARWDWKYRSVWIWRLN